MLSKCANPGCPAPFLYLRQGKLFRVETGVADPIAGEEEACSPHRIFLVM